MASADPQNESPSADPVMARITAVIERSRADPTASRADFAALWANLGPDADPFHLCTLAHYAADVQADPQDELVWDLRALAAAHRVADERVKRYHPGLTIAGFFPSLHLNLAEDYRKLGDPDAARRHLAEARARLSTLSDDGYGATVRTGIDRVTALLDAESQPEVDAGVSST